MLIVSPVLFGTGKRFFAEGTPAHAFELVSTTATPSGVILSAYKVVGPLKTGLPSLAALALPPAGISRVPADPIGDR